VQNRIGFAPVPVVLQVKTLKKLALALEGSFYGAQKKALAKAAGAGQKIVFALCCYRVDKLGFVYVGETFPDKIFKGLDSYGQFFHGLFPGLSVFT
jgi:hypothetical protein